MLRRTRVVLRTPRQTRQLWSLLRRKNQELRQASEELLERTQQRLNDDFASHRKGVSELRDALHIKRDDHTAYPPPARPYVADAFGFPQLGALSLKNERCEMAAGCELFAGQLTLVGCVGARFSEKMVDGWLEGGASAVADAQPPLQTLRLSLVDGVKYRWVRPLLLASMRLSVPADRHDSFYVCMDDLSEVTKGLRMSNRFLGYVCLVDGAGLIRWHVHSSKPPTTEEVATLAGILRARSWEGESSDPTVEDGAAAAATKIAQRNIDSGASRDDPRAARRRR